MKYTDCSHCGKSSVPLNDSLKINGKVICTACVESEYSDKQAEDLQVERMFDTTVCSFCGKDNGHSDFQKISEYPVCEECEVNIKNRTMPQWVKSFFAVIILIVIIGFTWNWRYYEGYHYIKKSNVAFGESDYEEAAGLMKLACERVPEAKDLVTASSFYNGCYLLSVNKCEEALKEFNYCSREMPDDFNIGSLIRQAKLGATFDNKDYAGFLSAAKENLEFDPDIAMNWAAVASAYACIYADNGTDTAKALALEHLQTARSMDSGDEILLNYYQRIEHRIRTRKIITGEDFNKAYPEGWHDNQN